MTNPLLKFYYDIAFGDKIKEVQNSFIGNPYFKKNGYSFYKPTEEYVKDEMVEDGSDPVFVTDSINKKRFFEIQLNREKGKVFNEFDNTQFSKEELSNFLSELKVIYEELDKNQMENFNFREITKQDLKLIINRVKKTYKDILPFHSAYTILKTLNTDESFFKVKDVSINCFKELYEATWKLELIDDVITSEDDFLNVLTSSRPTSEIQFIKPNPHIAYYLKKIQSFFYDLKPTTIQKSLAFKNKNGKNLSSQDIYTAISRKSKNFDRWANTVNSEIEEIEKKYLT